MTSLHHDGLARRQAAAPGDAARARMLAALRRLLAVTHRRLGLDRPRKDFTRGRLRGNRKATPKVVALDRAYRRRVEAEG